MRFSPRVCYYLKPYLCISRECVTYTTATKDMCIHSHSHITALPVGGIDGTFGKINIVKLFFNRIMF